MTQQTGGNVSIQRNPFLIGGIYCKNLIKSENPVDGNIWEKGSLNIGTVSLQNT